MRDTDTLTQTRKPMSQELHALFLEELSDVYDAEKRLTKALPKFVEAAQREELKDAFQSHLAETEGHVQLLEQVAQSLGEELESTTCDAMKGIVKEGEKLLKEQKDSSYLDAALIAAAQKVEHYEIATYGTLCAWAEEMGHTHELSLLQSILQQEKAADQKLTSIATSSANSQS